MPAPALGLLDQFNRANEIPLSGGGNWRRIQNGLGALNLVSNVVAGTTGTTNAMAWIGNGPIPGDAESYYTIATLPASGDALNCYLRLAQLDVTQNIATGYTAYWVATTGDVGIRRVFNNTFALLASGVTVAPAVGNRFGFTVSGSTFTLWIDTGSGWTSVLTATDATYTRGYVGVGMRGTNARIDDFGGGGTAVPDAHLVSQVAVEALVAAYTQARVSQVAVEVVTDSTPVVTVTGVRASQIAVEALRSPQAIDGYFVNESGNVYGGLGTTQWYASVPTGTQLDDLLVHAMVGKLGPFGSVDMPGWTVLGIYDGNFVVAVKYADTADVGGWAGELCTAFDVGGVPADMFPASITGCYRGVPTYGSVVFAGRAEPASMTNTVPAVVLPVGLSIVIALGKTDPPGSGFDVPATSTIPGFTFRRHYQGFAFGDWWTEGIELHDLQPAGPGSVGPWTATESQLDKKQWGVLGLSPPTVGLHVNWTI